MTEDEWFASNSLSDLLNHFKPYASDRKLRLFVLECYRQNIEIYEGLGLNNYFQYAELLVEGRIDDSERVKQEDQAYFAASKREEPYGDCGQFLYVPARLLAKQFDTDSSCELTNQIRSRAGSGGLGSECQDVVDWLEHDHIDYIRDIFGHLFHAVAFEAKWRDFNTLPIAAAMYDSRDFAAAPILADALEDAGCTEAAILEHLRDPAAVHVRGCWAVDLVLGKS